MNDRKRSRGGSPGGRNGRGTSQRQLRVGEQMRHLLAEYLSRGTTHDPRLERHNFTVSEVRVSPDLRAATVFVTELGGTLSAEGDAALRHVVADLAVRLTRQMNLRVVPRLSFVADETFEAASKMQSLISAERHAIHQTAESDEPS